MSVLPKRLRALGYPRFQEFNLSGKELQVAVCWLEEQKIRLYPSGGKERENLRKFEGDWLSCFKKYLDDLQSPEYFVGGEGEVGEAFEWLSSYALQLEYSDSKERYHVKTAGVIDLNWNQKEEMEVDQEEQDSEYHSPLYAEELRSLCKKIGLQVGESNDVEEMMRALSFDITTRFTDAAIHLAKQRAEIKKDEEFLLGPFSSPLQFTTGQEKVDRAACVLRFLHIVTLRQLQALINELIGIAQIHTADPKTDLKLGKVGV